jgi:glycosyltransferase involved in cell wall biosynthesis
VVGDAAILVEPEDVNAIAHGLRKVLLDETLRAELRARGLARATEFSWARSVATIHRAYTEAAARGR